MVKIIKVTSCWTCPFSDFKEDIDFLEIDIAPLFCFATTDWPVEVGIWPNISDNETIADICPLEDE